MGPVCVVSVESLRKLYCRERAPWRSLQRCFEPTIGMARGLVVGCPATSPIPERAFRDVRCGDLAAHMAVHGRHELTVFPRSWIEFSRIPATCLDSNFDREQVSQCQLFLSPTLRRFGTLFARRQSQTNQLSRMLAPVTTRLDRGAVVRALRPASFGRESGAIAGHIEETKAATA